MVGIEFPLVWPHSMTCCLVVYIPPIIPRNHKTCFSFTVCLKSGQPASCSRAFQTENIQETEVFLHNRHLKKEILQSA